MTPEVKQRIEQIQQGIVPEGYTKPRSGITPTNWTPACLGDIYTERKEPGNESLPLLTVSIHSGVSDGELDEDELPKKVKRIEDKSQYKRAATGDLVFNMMRAWQGAIGTVRTEGMVSPAYIVAKPNGKVYPPFMDYYMKAPRMVGMINRQSYGVTDFRKRLYWDSFAPIPCVLPPVREQRKIAEILSTQDKAIELQERKIDELKRFKKGCLERMFPRKGQKVPEKRFPGFTDDWEQRKVGEVSESYSGGTPSVGVKEYYGGQIPFIRSAEINSEITELFLTEEGLKNSSARLVAVGDILYALYGATSGEVGRARLKGAINQAILAIKPHTDYDSEYLAQWLRKSKHSIIETYLQGGQGNLSGTIVKELSVDFPSLKEQKAIGDFFRQLDNLITLHQRKLEEMKKQKKALMQLLLTGIVRVKA